MDGVVNVNKASGMTSHDVVLKLRRLLGEKRIGHTGTLDPRATGVLVLCIGKATRIARYLEAGDKEYRVVMRLGVRTDTYDADGRTTETVAYDPPDTAGIREVMHHFTGPIMQQPPVYSAIKVGGVPSYKLARAGKAEPLKQRPVMIHSIELTEYQDPYVHFTVQCGKGVYVRSLCADMGDSLGMGAHLTSLERTRSGSFRIEHALTLDQIGQCMADGRFDQFLIPVDRALESFPSAELGGADAVRVQHGNQVNCPAALLTRPDGIIRVHDASGSLLAIARIIAGTLRPELVFS